MKKTKKQAKIISCIMLVLLSCALLAPCLAGCGNSKAPAPAQPKLGIMLDDSFVTLGTVLPEDLEYVADADEYGDECTYLDLGPVQPLPQTYTTEDGEEVTLNYMEGLFQNVLQVDMDENDANWSKVGYIRINSAVDHPLVTEDGIELKTVSDIYAVMGKETSDLGYVWEYDGVCLEVAADGDTVIAFIILYA